MKQQLSMVRELEKESKIKKIWALILKFHLIELGITIFIYMIKGWLYVYSREHHPTGDIINMKIDDYIPFVPCFIVFYSLYYFLPQVTLWFLSFKNRKKFIRLIITVLIGAVICNVIYNIWQVTIVRPIPDTSNFFGWWVNEIYKVDMVPVNCFPSLHAYMGIIIVIAVVGECWLPRYAKIALAVSGLSIVISTVFVKQHYFIDSIIGAILPVVIYGVVWVIYKLIFERKEIFHKVEEINEK